VSISAAACDNLTVSDTEEYGSSADKIQGANITLDNNMAAYGEATRCDGLVATNNRGPAVEGL